MKNDPITERHPASRRARFLSCVIDYCLLSGSFLLVSSSLISFVEEIELSQRITPLTVQFFLAPFFVATILYVWRRMKAGTQTLGQRLMGVKLFTTEGQSASLGLWLGAYMGLAEGDDLIARLKMNYDPAIREGGTKVYSVSTRRL